MIILVQKDNARCWITSVHFDDWNGSCDQYFRHVLNRAVDLLPMLPPPLLPPFSILLEISFCNDTRQYSFIDAQN